MSDVRIFHGVDVSVAQGRIDHAKLVELNDLEFSLVRAGEGNEDKRADANYRVNVAGFMSTGIGVGAYYAPWCLPDNGNPTRDAKAQVARFWALSDGLGTRPGEMAPAVDLEWPDVPDWTEWGCNARQVMHFCQAALEETERLWDRIPFLYSYPSWWRSVLLAGNFGWARRYPLWLASYPMKPPASFPVSFRPESLEPWGKDGHTLLQWSGNAGVPLKGHPGVIDKNVFRGTTDDFLRLCNRDPAERIRAEVNAHRDAVRNDAITTVVEGAKRQ